MSESKTIRVGIVGAGQNTCSRHIPGLQAIDGVEIVSVCNQSKVSSQRVADRFGISTVYDRWERLVDADDTDAIVIGTWPYLHGPITIAALEAGKHVMCEARMAMNLDEARSMLEASRKHATSVAQVVPAPFSLGVDRTIQRLIAEGYVGKLLVIEIRDQNGAFLDPDDALTWRRNRELSGMNIMSLGIWYETMMRWAGEARRVTAMGKAWVAQRRDMKTGELKTVHVPEHIDVLAEMINGAQARILISSVMGGAANTEAWLCGSDGTLRFADGKLCGVQKKNGTLKEISPLPGEAEEWRVEEEFVGAIRGQEAIRLTDFEAGVRYMAFTEAVFRSLEDGGSIDIEA